MYPEKLLTHTLFITILALLGSLLQTGRFKDSDGDLKELSLSSADMKETAASR